MSVTLLPPKNEPRSENPMLTRLGKYTVADWVAFGASNTSLSLPIANIYRRIPFEESQS
jgi:hypothetical protein